MTSNNSTRLIFGGIALLLVTCFGVLSTFSFLPPVLQRIQGKVATCQDRDCSYNNGPYSFTLTMPDGWEPRSTSGNPFQIIYLLQPNTANAIAVEHYPAGGQSLDAFVDHFVADGRDSRDGTNRRNFTSIKTTFQGGEAAIVEYVWTGESTDFRTRILLFPKVDEIFAFWLTADQQQFTQTVPLFDSVLQSFKATGEPR